MFNIKNDFPLLAHAEQPFIYLDNAATTQKPAAVIDAMNDFYRNRYASVHRGIYKLSEAATQEYETARAKITAFLGAHPDEIVFTKGATESINFVATSWALTHLKAGHEIVVSELEHHANLVPWQVVARQTGAELRFIPIHPDGTLDLSKLDTLITKRTKLVAVTQISNALGTQVPVEKIIAAAKSVGAHVLIDGVQAVAHQMVNLADLDPDFYALLAIKC